MAGISRLAVLAIVVQACFAVLDANLQGPPLSPAFRMPGSQFLSNLTTISESKQDIFGRQSCGQGYSQCGYTGECCPQTGPTCCDKFCIALQPAGTDCCNGYMCPPSWECCGTSGNHCSPTDGVCCTAAGGFCPRDWDCCGNQGHCYPTDGWHCCSNDGSFCPNGSKCVYCSSGSSLICCQGADGEIVPPYNSDQVPTGGSGGGGGGGGGEESTPAPTPTSAEAPDPTTPAPTPETTEATPETSIEISKTPENPETTSLLTQYYTTIFTYTYTVWTRITYIQSIVDHTTTTTSTTLSCLATNRAAALPTLSSMASSVEASASSSAEAARPLSTGNNPTVTATVTSNPQQKSSGSRRWYSIPMVAICNILLIAAHML